MSVYTGPPTTSTTQKPFSMEVCFPKDAEPLPAVLDPLPPFVTIIECGSTQNCEPISERFGKYLG